ncbi:MAG: dihydroorotase [Acidobacteriota bacterium]|nr:dihydroorotase [Acidobacteriota bacterium]
MKLLIQNGRIVDPASRTEAVLDILIAEGRIAGMGSRLDCRADRTVDASGWAVCPGFIDMHVHLREPGYEHKETIRTGSRAAARGGFTTICCMSNTQPVNDSVEVTSFILDEAMRSSSVRIHPIASVTRGMKGLELTDMAALADAGAVAFSDDGRHVGDSGVMRRALEWADSLNRLVIDHCEDLALAAGGAMHEGSQNRRLGLKGIPSESEAGPVRRDIALARETRSRVHIAHLSVKGAVEAVREAKAEGVRVSAEATPHHLVLTDEALERPDPNLKMNPPLRGREDVDALVEAVRSGVVDAVATDHAPHAPGEKAADFDEAPFGVIGLETAVSILLDRFVHKNVFPMMRLVELLSWNPARLLGLEGAGCIAVGAAADLTLIDTSAEIVVDAAAMESKSRNTPFHGWTLRGCPVMTVVGGRIVFPFEP